MGIKNITLEEIVKVCFEFLKDALKYKHGILEHLDYENGRSCAQMDKAFIDMPELWASVIELRKKQLAPKQSYMNGYNDMAKQLGISSYQ